MPNHAPRPTSLLAFVLVLGCSAPAPPADSTPAGDQEAVPERAPNFQPPTLADDLVSNENGDLVSTSVLSVRFRIDASRSARQEAIDLVDGTVIGGLNPGTDGLYYVQVEGDGSIERIYEIAIALYRLPQVELASPYTVFSGQ